MGILAKILSKANSFSQKTIANSTKKKFAQCGQDVTICGGSIINGTSNISVGDHVYIGYGSLLYATDAKLIIGSYVTFGPKVTIITGDHRIDKVGEMMYNVKDKLPENDMDIVIENDVWVGCNTTILKGVTIGEGSVVGAGSLVTKDVPPYSIVGGVPAKKLKDRFSQEQLALHLEKIKQKN